MLCQKDTFSAIIPKNMYKNTFATKQFLFLWIAALLANIITFFWIIFKNNLQGPNVALKYSVQAGVLWYGDGRNLYYLPVLGLVILAINFILFKKLRIGQDFMKWTIVCTTIFIQLAILTGLAFLANVN